MATKKQAAKSRGKRKQRTTAPTVVHAPLIYSSLMLIKKSLPAIGKATPHSDDGNGQRGGFFTRSIDDITAALQPLMATNSVFAVPYKILEHVEKERRPLGSDGIGMLIFTKLKIQWRLYALDGSFIEAESVGEGMSDHQHSTAAAHSMAYKTMLQQVFMIRGLDESAPENADLTVGPLAYTEPLIAPADPLPESTEKRRSPGPVKPKAAPAEAAPQPDEPMSPGMVGIVRNNLKTQKVVTAESICKRFGVTIEQNDKPLAERANFALTLLKKSQMADVLTYIKSGGKEPAPPVETETHGQNTPMKEGA